MRMTANVAVIGSINMDLVIRSPKLPEPGETVIGRELETIPGGKGANQAVAAAKLGANVAMVGCVGGDVFAGQLKSNLAAAGVELTYVGAIRDDASGVALIVVDDSGQNTIVVASGANARLSPADVEAASEAIAATASSPISPLAGEYPSKMTRSSKSTLADRNWAGRIHLIHHPKKALCQSGRDSSEVDNVRCESFGPRAEISLMQHPSSGWQ